MSGKSQAMLQFEQQVEMMDTVFMRSIESCSKKCIPSGNMEINELNKGESVCVKRCIDKFFSVLELVGTELNDMGMNNTDKYIFGETDFVKPMEQFTEKLTKWSNDPKNIESIRESCLFNVLSHGGMGFAFGGFLGMFLASMSAGGTSPETQLFNPNASNNNNTVETLPLRIQIRHALKDMTKRTWSSAKNFGAIAALYSGSECIIEGYRAKHDIVNSLSAGCLTGGILSAKGGPKSALIGCAGFAAFSAAIEIFTKEK